MEIEKIIYKAKDGRLFDDPLKCEDYEKTVGILPGSVGDLINELEKDDKQNCYMFGVVLVREKNGTGSIYTRYTANIDYRLEDYVNVSNLTEEQLYESTTIGDFLETLKKLDKDLMCQYMIVYSHNIDLSTPGLMVNFNKEAWPKQKQ